MIEILDKISFADEIIFGRIDNQKIKDNDPKEYMKLLNQEAIPDILQAAICPQNTFELRYEKFIKERNKMLLDYARQLIK